MTNRMSALQAQAAEIREREMLVIGKIEEFYELMEGSKLQVSDGPEHAPIKSGKSINGKVRCKGGVALANEG